MQIIYILVGLVGEMSAFLMHNLVNFNMSSRSMSSPPKDIVVTKL